MNVNRKTSQRDFCIIILVAMLAPGAFSSEKSNSFLRFDKARREYLYRREKHLLSALL